MSLFLLFILAAQHDTAAISRYVRAEMERQRIPGLSLAVLRGDSIVLSRGYGFANVELRVPASDSTVYQSGSMGKQFTAALVEMLVEQGRLRLDDSIVRWFPEGADVWPGVTVRRLLTHTAGIYYLGAHIGHICHARSERPSGGGTAVSVFYATNWRAAGVEGYGY